MYFERTTWFTGRNGMFKASGLNIWKAVDNLIVFSPITTKGKPGRCDIAIPEEFIPELIRKLDEYCKIELK